MVLNKRFTLLSGKPIAILYIIWTLTYFSNDLVFSSAPGFHPIVWGLWGFAYLATSSPISLIRTDLMRLLTISDFNYRVNTRYRHVMRCGVR